MGSGYVKKYSQPVQHKNNHKPAHSPIAPWKIFLIILGVLALIAVTIVLVYQSRHKNEVKPIPGTEEELAVIGTCQDWDVLYEELRYVTLNFKLGLEKEYGKDIWDDPIYQQKLSDLVWKNITANYAVLSLCKEVRLELGDPTIAKVVQKNIESIVKDPSVGSMEVYKEILASQYLTDHYVRFTYEVDALENELYYAYTRDLQLFDCDTEAEFLSYALDGGLVRTIHIVIKLDKKDNPDDNRALAYRIKEELDAGADFNDMIGRYSEDYHMVGDDGYYFTAGEMNESYETAAFGLLPDQYSDVVEIDGDYYIIKRLELDRNYIVQNLASLFQYYQYSCLNERVSKRQAELSVVLNDYGKSLELWKIQ